MGVAVKSAAKIYRNSRKLSSLLMDVVMIYFYSKRFRFAPSFNKRYSKLSIFWLLFKKNRQICITLEQDDSDRLWTILILLIKSQNVMDFWLVVLFLQGPRLYLRASTSLNISLDWYFLLVGIILSNIILSNVILGYAILSNVYLNNVFIIITYQQRYRC